MGPGDAIPLDEEMESRTGASGEGVSVGSGNLRYQVIVLLVAVLVFLGCMISPPSLMDDVDAVQAQIAQNMLQSGDWVLAQPEEYGGAPVRSSEIRALER